jgi:hypothetical protein
MNFARHFSRIPANLRFMNTSPHKMVATVLIFVSLAAVGQKAQAVVPAPDGCYPTFTTAEGCDALNLLTSGAGNTGLGWRSLFSTSTGNFNTGVGAGALVLNNADDNTAVGAATLLLNTAGHDNTATGTGALVSNDSGNFNTANGAFALNSSTASDQNTAVGYQALFSNGTGLNTAVGYQALFANLGGLENTAMGDQALLANTGGFFNVAVGGAALIGNVSGNDNTACGGGALAGATGNDNTAIGFQAGINSSTGSNNVYIGSMIGGVAGESNACYIASIFNQTSANGAPVLINSFNKLGVATSSKRFKNDIKPMDKASETIFALQPVTFRYKKNLDPEGTPQFGLVAEDVQNVSPALVVRDKEGKPYSVRYDQVNAMLLNEFLKEHKAFVKEQRKVQSLEAALDAVNQRLKEQEAKIEKVSAQIQMNKPAPQVARVP